MTHDLQQGQPQGWQEHRVAQGLLLRNHEVLLSANLWYSDKPPVWSLPGGRAEPGEALQEALCREFLEETGLEVAVDRLAYVVEARSITRKALFFTTVFVVSALRGTLSCEADPAVMELRFVTVAELQAYMPSPSLGQPLVEYLRSADRYPRYWFFPEY